MTYEHGIFVSGPPRAGKSTFVQCVSTDRYKIVRAARVIRDYGLPLHSSPLRADLQQKGQELLERLGFDGFAEVLLNAAEGAEFVIFDGIRPLMTICILRKRFRRFHLVYIDASVEVREERLRSLGEHEFPTTLSHPIEKMTLEAKAHSNFVIDNNGTLDDFCRQVDNLAGEIILSKT